MTAHTTSGPSSPYRPWKLLMLLVGAVLTITMIGNGTYWVVDRLAHTIDTTNVAFAGPITRIVVRGDIGAIALRGGQRDDVAGSREVGRSLQTPRVSERRDGDTLTLDSDCGAIENWCSVSYTLDVPRNAVIDADSSAGSIRVADLDASISLRSSAGELTVDNVTGPVSMKTNAGSLRGTKLMSRDVTVDSRAGEVRLDFVVAPDRVAVDMRAGSLRVIVPPDGTAYNVDASTHIGDVSVRVPRNDASPHSIRATSSAGQIVVATG